MAAPPSDHADALVPGALLRNEKKIVRRKRKIRNASRKLRAVGRYYPLSRARIATRLIPLEVFGLIRFQSCQRDLQSPNGFFTIWHLPTSASSGLLSPARPATAESATRKVLRHFLCPRSHLSNRMDLGSSPDNLTILIMDPQPPTILRSPQHTCLLASLIIDHQRHTILISTQRTCSLSGLIINHQPPHHSP